MPTTFTTKPKITTSGLLAIICLTTLSANAAESDELAAAQRLLTQAQAALDRADQAAVQASHGESTRFYFDYSRVRQDLNIITAGIDHYRVPSRAQPREAGTISGQYRRQQP